MQQLSIVFIGAGKVATYLALAFQGAGHHILQVYSRSYDRATALADRLGCESATYLSVVSLEADVYIVAVSDDAIVEVLDDLAFLQRKLIVHTSGATGSQVFAKGFTRFGVFYPLQSFSKESKLHDSLIPFCINANTHRDRQLLAQLALSIGGAVYYMDDRQRLVLHCAAVLVNNFTNHLFTIALGLCQSEGVAFDALLPLIRETVLRMSEAAAPAELQTGPAIRNDLSTIQRHLDLLAGQPEEWQAVYLTMTQSIVAYYGK